MKKIWIAIAVIVLALLVLAGTLIYLLVALPRLSQQQTETGPGGFLTVEGYVAETWQDYRFVSCKNGVLTLEYNLSGTYAQLQKHGPAAGYDAVAAGHLDTGKLIRQGCNLRCNVVLREVVVLGISSDGKEVYRASTVDGVTACWD